MLTEHILVLTVVMVRADYIWADQTNQVHICCKSATRVGQARTWTRVRARGVTTRV